MWTASHSRPHTHDVSQFLTLSSTSTAVPTCSHTDLHRTNIHLFAQWILSFYDGEKYPNPWYFVILRSKPLHTKYNAKVRVTFMYHQKLGMQANFVFSFFSYFPHHSPPPNFKINKKHLFQVTIKQTSHPDMWGLKSHRKLKASRWAWSFCQRFSTLMCLLICYWDCVQRVRVK